MKHKDIADKLQVSTATVSNALSGKGRMRPRLRQEIIALAESGGYNTKNPPIRRQSSNLITVLAEQLADVFPHRILTGISRAARENGLLLQIHDMGMAEFGFSISPGNRQFSGFVRESLRMVDSRSMGLIYLSQYPRDLTGLLPKLSYPVVYAYGYTDDSGYCVNVDDEQGACMATTYLLEHGSQRPAMLCGPVDNIPTSNRYIGFQRALVHNSLPLEPELIRISDWNAISGYVATKELLVLPGRPDAIFAQDDALAMGAIRAALEKGLQIPRDISVIGFDNLIAEFTTPTMSTVNPPFERVGEIAAETLLRIIRGKAPEKKKLTVPCSLELRESC